MMLQPGMPVERYIVQAVLGRGGMATVYRVKHAVLGTQHALKVLNDDRPDIAERLIREGRMQARLDPAHIVPVHDVLTVNASPALLMPLVRGSSLKEILRDYSPSESEAAFLLLGIARGLAAAHARGIVHRDLKPGNVLLELKHGKLAVRVADFGVARIKDGSLNTTDQGILGTVAYASPEQLQESATADARADLWSLGVVAYELLVGERPFRAKQTGAMLIRVLAGTYDEDRLPESWRALVGRLLTVDLEARISGIEQVVQELEGRGVEPPALDSGLTEALRKIMEHELESGELDLESTLAPSAHSSISEHARHNLPAARDAFIGRHDAMRGLDEKLGSGARLVTVLGVAGSGKTRLAIEYAHRNVQAWPGGVWLCDLTEARSMSGVHGAIARALGVQLSTRDEMEHLGDAIAGRGKVLIILDNLEQVVDVMRPMLRSWLSRAPEAVFLCTSRTLLAVHGEHTAQVGMLEREGARELFLHRARQSGANIEFSQDDIHAVDLLVEQLDRLPLAIELAAARVRMMSPQKMLTRIGQRFKLLSGSGRDVERHRTLREALDWSWDLLSDWEQMALAQCSVFEGGFDLEAAEAVLDLEAFDTAPWPMDAIRSLVDKSLVRTLGDDRFGLLMSVQEYAREKLVSLGGMQGAHDRHERHYAAFGTEQALDALDRHGGLERRENLHREIHNLMTAWERASGRGDGRSGLPLALAICSVLEMTGPLSTAAKSAETCGALVEDDAHGSARVWLAAGMIRRHQGQYDVAWTHVSRALELEVAAGNRRLEGVLRMTLGRLSSDLGRHAAAREQYAAALAIHRQDRHRQEEGLTLRNIGILDLYEGRYAEAQAHLTQALAIHREVGNRRAEGIVLGNLGVLHSDLGRSEVAEQVLEQALGIQQAVKNRREEGIILRSLAILMMYGGRRDVARQHFERALRMLREVGDRRFEGVVCYNLADLAYMEGSLDEAVAALEECLSAARMAFRPLVAVAQGTQAKVLARRGESEDARAVLTEGEGVIRAWGYRIELAKFIAKKATVLALLHERSAGQAALGEAIALYETLGVQDAALLFELNEARTALGIPVEAPS